LAVAYSGGRDSTALLHATLAVADRLGLRVVALHVHHGLSAHADEWLDHCETQCESWAASGAPVELRSRRVTVDPAGSGVEAAARHARYAALAEMAREAGCDLVLLAHHRDDQAETVLLQALRGAGMAGLAAMPGSIERDGLTWARPWLNRPRSEIDRYVAQHGLAHIDDDSNSDSRYARNRLRHDVWPTFGAAFPQASQALTSVAAYAQEAVACLADLAAIDLHALRREGSLSRSALLVLPVHRRANALRHWLAETSGAPVPASLLHRLLAELGGDRPARWPLDVDREVRLYRDVISIDRAAVKSAIAPVIASVDATPALDVCVTAPGRYALGAWPGLLSVESADADAPGVVPLARLACLQARPRQGGEQFQRAANAPPRSLKKQYQAAGVPAWQREGPLLWCDGQLLFAPGLGVDARWQAGHDSATGGPCCSLRWIASDGGTDRRLQVDD
jgi:tRNA(Ile)-lysidine synthase